MSSQNHALLVTTGRRIRALRKAKGWTPTDTACTDGLELGQTDHPYACADNSVLFVSLFLALSALSCCAVVRVAKLGVSRTVAGDAGMNVAEPPAIALVVEVGFGLVYGSGCGFRSITRTPEASRHHECSFGDRCQGE